MNTPHPFDLIIGLDRSDRKADPHLIDTRTGSFKKPEILAVLARRSRRVRDGFCLMTRGVARGLAVPRANICHPSGVSNWPCGGFSISHDADKLLSRFLESLKCLRRFLGHGFAISKLNSSLLEPSSNRVCESLRVASHIGEADASACTHNQ